MLRLFWVLGFKGPNCGVQGFRIQGRPDYEGGKVHVFAVRILLFRVFGYVLGSLLC